MPPPPREAIYCHETAHKIRGAIEIWWIARFPIFLQISLKHGLSEIFGWEEFGMRKEFVPDVAGDTLLFSFIENAPMRCPICLSRCP
jgi:hypothetical protein